MEIWVGTSSHETSWGHAFFAISHAIREKGLRSVEGWTNRVHITEYNSHIYIYIMRVCVFSLQARWGDRPLEPLDDATGRKNLQKWIELVDF